MKQGFKLHKVKYIVAPIILILIWGLIENFYVKNEAILPSPLSVLRILILPFSDLLGTGPYIYHIFISLVRVLTGFILSSAFAIVLGIFSGRNVRIRVIVNPIVEFLRPICPIAWIPFAMVVFGMNNVASLLGLSSVPVLSDIYLGMVFVIFYGAFFPVYLNTFYGVTHIKNTYIESAKLLGATDKNLFKDIILPAAIPDILSGLKIGLGTAWMVIIAAEMLPGSESGIGYLIIYAYDLARMDILVASMILTGIVGTLLSLFLHKAEIHFGRWKIKDK